MGAASPLYFPLEPEGLKWKEHPSHGSEDDRDK